MTPEGPYVSVAALCEYVLDEKDNRISCIRFLDRIEINRTYSRPLKPGEEIPTLVPLLQVTGFLALKSGNFKGKKMLDFNVLKPSGEPMKEEEGQTTESFPLLFEGDEHGVQVILRMSLKLEVEGLYWIEAKLDGEQIIARIPLRVVFSHTQADGSQEKNLTPDDTAGSR
jgi:hypothetical protein